MFCIPSILSDCKAKTKLFHSDRILELMRKEKVTLSIGSKMIYNQQINLKSFQVPAKEFFDYYNGYTDTLSSLSNIADLREGVVSLQNFVLPEDNSIIEEIDKKISYPLSFNSSVNGLHYPVPMANYSPLSVYATTDKSYLPMNQSLSRCCLVDINHGEGECIWTVIHYKYLP
jgi:hypothetical protein